MEPRTSENAFEPLREAAISDSVLTHPALIHLADVVLAEIPTFAGKNVDLERDEFSWKQSSSENAFERMREAAFSDSMQTHPALGNV